MSDSFRIRLTICRTPEDFLALCQRYPDEVLEIIAQAAEFVPLPSSMEFSATKEAFLFFVCSRHDAMCNHSLSNPLRIRITKCIDKWATLALLRYASAPELSGMLRFSGVDGDQAVAEVFGSSRPQAEGFLAEDFIMQISKPLVQASEIVFHEMAESLQLEERLIPVEGGWSCRPCAGLLPLSPPDIDSPLSRAEGPFGARASVSTIAMSTVGDFKRRMTDGDSASSADGTEDGAQSEHRASAESVPPTLLWTRGMYRTRTRKPHWVEDKCAPACFLCGKHFSRSVRKHHCRYCGFVFCWECSPNRFTIPELGYDKKVRVCELCENAFAASSLERRPKESRLADLGLDPVYLQVLMLYSQPDVGSIRVRVLLTEELLHILPDGTSSTSGEKKFWCDNIRSSISPEDLTRIEIQALDGSQSVELRGETSRSTAELHRSIAWNHELARRELSLPRISA